MGSSIHFNDNAAIYLKELDAQEDGHGIFMRMYKHTKTWFENKFKDEEEQNKREMSFYRSYCMLRHPEWFPYKWRDTPYYLMLERAEPHRAHRFLWWLARLPKRIHIKILCFGSNYKDPKKDRHLTTLLVNNKQFTWLDKVRFKLVTGYTYNNH